LPNTPDIIGLPAGPDALGTIHLPPSKPAPPVAPPPTEIGLPIAAPPQTALLATPEHSTGDVPKFGSTNGTAARTSSPRRGPDDGLDDNDDEETISLMNPGHGGGHGSGSGKRGNGIDRGGYGGGDLDAKVRDLAKLNYDGPPPKQAVTLHVIVHADGTVGKITVSESSGNDDYDEACVEAARESQYTPQRVDGKYVEGSADITLGTLLK
jgi:TonB family protein